MKRRVLDTNILIALWHGRVGGGRRVESMESAEASARAWLAATPDDAIVTPVRLEFLAGTRSREELKVAEHFLSFFPLLDAGRVLPEDWHEAERLVRRVPPDGRPRGTLDCLSLALANRLRAKFHTLDTGVPRGRDGP